MGLDDLDIDRIENYFRVILERPISRDVEIQEWQKFLLNSDLLAKIDDKRSFLPSPPPNEVIVGKMKEGIVRVTRNGLIKEILRSYRYVDHYGMGIGNRIFWSMLAHYGTIPNLTEEED